MVMHGTRKHSAGCAGADDHARPRRGARRQARPRRRRHALRLLRREPVDRLPQTLPRSMKETGCGAVKHEGGRRMAETIRFLVERRHSGDGAHRPHAAVDQCAGRLQEQGRVKDEWAAIEEDARLVAEAGAFLQSCSRPWRRSSRARSRRQSRSPPSASARPLAATARSS